MTRARDLADLASSGVIEGTEVADDAITYAKIQNVTATDKILGRDSSGAGIVEEISPASLRTMINVADGSNAYTHPNHSGEVTSTNDGATVITDNIVDEANLKISNAGSNGEFLSKQSGNTGGLTWAGVTGFDVTSITGATALGATPADTDEFVLSDAGVLKRVDYSHIKGGTNELDFFVKNVSQTFSASTNTKVDFSNEQWDTGSAFDTTNKRFVCPVGKAGKYWFAFSMMLTDASADGKEAYSRLTVNGSTTYYWFQGKVSTSFTNDNPSMTCSGIVNLAESDYVEVFLRHNNSSSLIWAGDYGAFWGFRLVQ